MYPKNTDGFRQPSLSYPDRTGAKRHIRHPSMILRLQSQSKSRSVAVLDRRRTVTLASPAKRPEVAPGPSKGTRVLWLIALAASRLRRTTSRASTVRLVEAFPAPLSLVGGNCPTAASAKPSSMVHESRSWPGRPSASTSALLNATLWLKFRMHSMRRSPLSPLLRPPERVLPLTIRMTGS
jgi:hypothetical protein